MIARTDLIFAGRSVCCSFSGPCRRQTKKNGQSDGGPFVLASQSVIVFFFTLRHPTCEIMPPRGNLVPTYEYCKKNKKKSSHWSWGQTSLTLQKRKISLTITVSKKTSYSLNLLCYCQHFLRKKQNVVAAWKEVVWQGTRNRPGRPARRVWKNMKVRTEIWGVFWRANDSTTSWYHASLRCKRNGNVFSLDGR